MKAPLEAQRWIHAVAVADGKEVTLYVDGKKCDAAAATGMVIPGPKYYYVGCDTNSDGNPEFLTKSVIALLISLIMQPAASMLPLWRAGGCV